MTRANSEYCKALVLEELLVALEKLRQLMLLAQETQALASLAMYMVLPNVDSFGSEVQCSYLISLISHEKEIQRLFGLCPLAGSYKKV